MATFTAEEVLSLVDKNGEVTFTGGQTTMKISKGNGCYCILQGSPQTFYGQDLYTYQRALDFISKELKNGVYETMST